MTQEQIKSAKVGDRFAVGASMARHGTPGLGNGTPGEEYFVVRMQSGWAVQEVAKDRKVPFIISDHQTYWEARKAAADKCDSLYR